MEVDSSMDVKEVRNSQVNQEKIATEKSTTEGKIRKSAETLSVSAALQSATVNIDSKPRSNSRSELRGKVNEIINVTNVATEATSQISDLVKSIDGIVEQAKAENTTDQRKAILEEEANQLVNEIKKAALQSADNGVKPLAGGTIRLEVEERIGKTLEVILPDEASAAFGLGKISFSTKDSIISTIASVEAALNSITRLREAVSETAKNIEETVKAVDVAIQNAEASETSVRDLDMALRLASETSVVISKDPDKALSSVGKLNQGALGLLE